MSTFEEVVRLMNPNSDKMYGWNLSNILDPAIGTIEFRRGTGSTSAQDVFAYIKITMSFLEAAIQLGNPKARKHTSHCKWAKMVY